MPSVGFELTIAAGVRPITYALDRAATGTGSKPIYSFKLLCKLKDNLVTGPIRARSMCLQHLNNYSQLGMLRLNLLIIQICMSFRTSINRVISIMTP